MAVAIKRYTPPDSITALAKKLGVSRSALYYQPKLPAKDLALKADIEKVMVKHQAYGHRRIAWELKVNKKRVKRVMRIFNLRVKRKRKKPFKPQDQGQKPTTIPNLILGLTVDSPNQVWVSDFTYLPYFGKFVYLATVEDVFTRQVVGWAMSTRHNADLVALALLDAIISHPAPRIVHSDQGSEYRDVNYLNLIKSLNIKPSMSAKASPWQNGYQESFYSGFKLELGHPEIYADLGELYEATARQIYYYNYCRIHTALKCPPVVFAQRLNCQNIKLINQENPLRLSV
ncbi:MAG: IS3 family transposase [Candidatus Azambacteria bacterium]|nr:IS3 family transposase [Candidatus Azambacteria bacterium]